MSFNGHYAPQETSLFDEQMSAFEPSFADPSSMNLDANDAYPVVDDATTGFRPPSADGLYQPYPPETAATGSRVSSPLPTYSGAVAPFSQVFSNHLSPFSASGAFPPIASTSSVPPAYPTFPAGVGVPPASTLAVQAAIHQQQRGVVQQHPGFLDPRQQAELLQTHQGGIAPATITPSQVQQQQSFSIASTPSTSGSPPPPPAASSQGTTKSSSSSSKSSSGAKKANGTSSGVARAKQRPPSASPAPPAPAVKYEYDPEEWQQILPGVRTLLSAKRLQASPLATAPKLLKDLRFFSHETRADSPWGDTSDVPPEGRAEVLQALLKYAKDEFWRVFLETGQGKPASSSTTTAGGKGKGKENGDDQQQQMAGIKSDALDLLQAWLEGASKAVLREKGGSGGSGTSEKDRRRKELEQATLVLVLQVLAKLPVEYGHLIEFKKIPKRVKSISEKAADGAVKSAATHLVAKWQKVQERAYSSTATPSSAAAAPKRKADSTDVPAKKVKTSATPPPPAASNTVKKATIAPTVPKAPLPSFKKVPPPAPALPAFMAAISQMSKAASTTTAESAVPQGGTAATAPATAAAPKQKQKKKVHWPADDADLCKIREIEARELSAKQAASEEIGGEQHHLMEEQEGQTLGMHLLDEEDEEWEPELDWYEPPPVEIPDLPEFAPLHEPKQSAEVAIQEAREAATMQVDLASSATPPESPSEELVADAPAVDDSDAKRLGLHPDLADDPAYHNMVAQAQLGLPPAGSVASNDLIANLLGQLTQNGTLQHLEAAAATTQTAPLPPALVGLTIPTIGAGPPGPHAPPPPAPAPAPIDTAALEQLRHFEPARIAQIAANMPELRNLDLSAIGVAVPGQQAANNQFPYAGAAGYPPVQQQYQGYAPPPPLGSQPWGPPPPQPPNNYNGYQPPASMAPPPQGFGQPQPPPVPVPVPRAPGKNQNWANYRTQPCKFFRTPKGCDWGDRCRFLHQ